MAPGPVTAVQWLQAMAALYDKFRQEQALGIPGAHARHQAQAGQLVAGYLRASAAEQAMRELL